MQSHGKRCQPPPLGRVRPFGRFDGGSNTGSLCPGHLDGAFGLRMVRDGQEAKQIRSLLLTPPRLITLQGETKERCSRVLSAAIYTPRVGRVCRHPAGFQK